MVCLSGNRVGRDKLVPNLEGSGTDEPACCKMEAKTGGLNWVKTFNGRVLKICCLSSASVSYIPLKKASITSLSLDSMA